MSIPPGTPAVIPPSDSRLSAGEETPWCRLTITLPVDGCQPCRKGQRETLRLTNDHNPKPLRYQFEAEYKGLFEWTSLQEGPKDWIFAIRRLKS